jgi:hypothetical protein
MQKKSPKLKTLRLRKEALKTLTTDHLIQVNGGSWDDQATQYPVCQNA